MDRQDFLHAPLKGEPPGSAKVGGLGHLWRDSAGGGLRHLYDTAEADRLEYLHGDSALQRDDPLPFCSVRRGEDMPQNAPCSVALLLARIREFPDRLRQFEQGHLETGDRVVFRTPPGLEDPQSIEPVEPAQLEPPPPALAHSLQSSGYRDVGKPRPCEVSIIFGQIVVCLQALGLRDRV